MIAAATPYRNCYVAFLDVLGFKELVEGSTHDHLHRLYSNAFVSNAAMSVSNGAFKVVEGETGQIAIPDFAKAKVSCLVVSDSVLLYSSDDSMTSFIDICAAVGKLMVSGFFTGLPMRGGISLGPISIFGGEVPGVEFGIHGLVGLPLVRAYGEEAAYEWAGCTIEPLCIDHYRQQSEQFRTQVPDLATIEVLSARGMLTQYAAPLKKGTTVERWVIDWPNHNKSTVSTDTVRKAFGMHGKPIDAPSVQQKIANTLAFLEFSRVARDAQG